MVGHDGTHLYRTSIALALVSTRLGSLDDSKGKSHKAMLCHGKAHAQICDIVGHYTEINAAHTESGEVYDTMFRHGCNVKRGRGNAV
jgi:hypothetical protein